MDTASPNIQLLLLCCRHHAGTATADEIATFLAAHDVGWDALIPESINHHLLPIIYKGLKKVEVPHGIMRTMRQLYLQIVAQNVQMTEALHSITRFLADAKITTCAIKGPVLASEAFGSISWRLFSDLDLIVPRTQLLQAIDALSRHGFNLSAPVSTIDRTLYLKTQQEWTLVDASGKIHLDVKPAVISHTISPSQLTEQLFAIHNTVTNKEIRGIPAPNADIMLLLVCMHGVHAKWNKLSQVMDVAGLILRNTINWKALLETAKTWGQARSLLMGLALCSELVHIDLPEEIRQRLAPDPKLRLLVEETSAELLAPNHDFDPEPYEKWRFERLTRDSVADRISTGFRQFMTLSSKDIEYIKLPTWLAFLYPIVRFLRLARINRDRQIKPV